MVDGETSRHQSEIIGGSSVKPGFAIIPAVEEMKRLGILLPPLIAMPKPGDLVLKKEVEKPAPETTRSANRLTYSALQGPFFERRRLNGQRTSRMQSGVARSGSGPIIGLVPSRFPDQFRQPFLSRPGPYMVRSGGGPVMWRNPGRTPHR